MTLLLEQHISKKSSQFIFSFVMMHFPPKPRGFLKYFILRKETLYLSVYRKILITFRDTWFSLDRKGIKNSGKYKKL